jgi:predicted HTH domain antitoxin
VGKRNSRFLIYNWKMARDLYESKKVSPSRAAENAGTSPEGFEDILEYKGMKREVAAPTKDKMSRS